MIINQNTLSNPNDIIKFANTFTKNFTPRRQLQKLLLLNFLEKFLTEKIYNERKISLDDIIKSLNSHTNDKFQCNDGLAAEFYIHFLNKLVSVLLDFYDSCEKVDTMGVISRTGIIFDI